MELHVEQFSSAMPSVRAPRVWLAMLKEAMTLFEINSPTAIVSFLAQISRETNQCRNLEEDLSFTAAALRRTWPKRFPTLTMAQAYERHPERLANYLYANRFGNGPPESRDGYRFRGRGLIRITGRANYRAAGDVLGLDLERQPELLLVPRHAAMSAAWRWKARASNERTEDESSDEDVEDLRRQNQPRVTPISLFVAAGSVRFPAGE